MNQITKVVFWILTNSVRRRILAEILQEKYWESETPPQKKFHFYDQNDLKASFINARHIPIFHKLVNLIAYERVNKMTDNEKLSPEEFR